MFRSLIPVFFCAAAVVTVANAQEYQLKNGRRFPADRVKPAGDTFTAVVSGVAGGAPETVTFGVKDISQVTMAEPSELSQARKLLVEGKPSEAAEAVKPALEKTKGLQAVPGSWWPEALMIQIDALSTAGKSIQDLPGTDDATIRKLPSSDADSVREMIEIATKGKEAKPESVDALKSVAKSTANSWILGRAWLQIGDIYSNQGKLEDAVKSWLRVPVFSGAEKDLALRGTLAAARGLQQMSNPTDGKQLLEDYLTDYPLNSSKDYIDSEIKKLTPKEKETSKQ